MKTPGDHDVREPDNAPTPRPIARDVFRQMPKVLLHDHLDGGLRPQTIIDLAKDDPSIVLPAHDPEELRQWFFRGANRGSLVEYLEGFAVTCGVMQTAASLERVAYELMEDMRADGVVYTEVRFAPILHLSKGLNLEQVMTAVYRGLERGKRDFGVHYGIIVCALRNMDPAISLKMAELAVAYREKGCVAFDLAGEEAGHPAKDHLEAFHYCKRENFNITIHAGEAFGPPSIWQALQYCGAHRIGHGTRLIEDMVIAGDSLVYIGTLANYVRDHRVPIEVCLQSNIHTGAAPSLEEHPFRFLVKNHFRVTLNTDNRLMSKTTMTDEYEIAHLTYGLTSRDFEKLSLNGMKSAFAHFDERLFLIYDVIKSGYRDLRYQGLIDPAEAER